MNRCLLGDCLTVLPTLAADSIDACVTDPPYGLSFMGKQWDKGVPGVEFWAEVFRVLKPGAHLLAFGGTRTYHRMVCAIEDAGFEIRDQIQWIFGSGFPKSMDVSKAIDNAAGAERPLVVASGGLHQNPRLNDDGWSKAGTDAPMMRGPDPVTDASRQWNGWGTALKPAHEPIVLARKPLIGTVAANVLQHGTGALNIEGCRVDFASKDDKAAAAAAAAEQRSRHVDRSFDGWGMQAQALSAEQYAEQTSGRWPANIIHDGSAEVVALFPSEAGAYAPVRGTEPSRPAKNTYGEFSRGGGIFHNDSGSAARFFYCAKADREDRNEGCEGMARKALNWSSGEQSPGTFQSENTDRASENHHPTVKPCDLMRYLCRLITPPGGVILDPFGGSGSTGKAAALEGFGYIIIEREAEYHRIAEARIAHALAQPMQLAFA